MGKCGSNVIDVSPTYECPHQQIMLCVVDMLVVLDVSFINMFTPLTVGMYFGL